MKNSRRTTVGIRGLDMDEIVDFICAFLDGAPQNPRKDVSMAYTLNFAVDDLKAYYYESVAAQPGSVLPSSRDLESWFWGETAAAKVLFAVKDRCLRSDDKIAARWQVVAYPHVAKPSRRKSINTIEGVYHLWLQIMRNRRCTA